MEAKAEGDFRRVYSNIKKWTLTQRHKMRCAFAKANHSSKIEEHNPQRDGLHIYLHFISSYNSTLSLNSGFEHKVFSPK